MLESILTVSKQVLIEFFLMAVGFLLGKLKLFDKNASRGCSQLIVYVVSPCMMIVAFQRSFDSENFQNFCWALILAVIIHIFLIALSCIALRSKDEKTDLLRFSVILSNCGFMGYPLQTALLGSIGVFYGSAFSTIWTIVLWTYGVILMSGGNSKPSLKTLMLNPGILSVFIALAFYLTQIQLPDIILQPITYLSQLNTPLPMIVVGFQLSQANLLLTMRGKSVWLSIILRLFVAPLIAMLLCIVLSIDKTVSIAIIVATATPCAAMLSIFASKFQRDSDLTSSLVASETLLSAFTMPIMVGIAMVLC